MQKQNGLKVVAAKSFPVPVDKLYEAWTDAESLKQWWKPMGNKLVEVTNDIKQGGKVSYTFTNQAFVISGEYLEVKENEKLVYTWNWELPNDAVRNADYMLTVEFKSNGNNSEIQITQENFESEEALHPHQEGWEKGLSELEQFLAGGTSSETKLNESQPSGEASDGYRESPEQVKVGGA